jgi:hypothetical protein
MNPRPRPRPRILTAIEYNTASSATSQAPIEVDNAAQPASKQARKKFAPKKVSWNSVNNMFLALRAITRFWPLKSRDISWDTPASFNEPWPLDLAKSDDG